MGVGERRTKDAAMASYMKAHKIERTSARCPICNQIVTLTQLPIHIAHHPAAETKVGKNH